MSVEGDRGCTGAGDELASDFGLTMEGQDVS